jgi:mannose-6-phosphate isomerase-like protein (cupin superfamily)
MSADLQPVGPEQVAYHEAAEAKMKSFKYTEPREGFVRGKVMVPLARTEVLKAIVQVLREGGENNLHYHKNIDSFWYVLSGKVRFYGPGDKLLGEFGRGEGIVTPRGARYWFESAGGEQLELLQVAGTNSPGVTGRDRVDAAPNANPPRVTD